jgi:hypothetical protein
MVLSKLLIYMWWILLQDCYLDGDDAVLSIWGGPTDDVVHHAAAACGPGCGLVGTWSPIRSGSWPRHVGYKLTRAQRDDTSASPFYRTSLVVTLTGIKQHLATIGDPFGNPGREP